MGDGHVFVLQGDPAQLATDAMVEPGSAGDRAGPGLVEHLDAHLAAAAAELHGRAPGHGRARPLLGLVLPGGTRAGARAPLLRTALGSAQRAATASPAPDVVVLAHDRGDYATLQALRRTWASPPTAASQRLAALARADRLVAFLGAGVSRGAGVPGWQELIAALADRAGLAQRERERLLALRPWDAAAILAGRLDVPRGVALQQELRAPGGQHSLTHGLIASMRLPGVITTNWDDRYERAARVPTAGGLRVLPRDLPDGSAPWLLKLHGDLGEPDSIVLTRDDSLDFDANRVPLASMLQSHMITHHLLLLGYSLSDDSFVRLARQVRALLGGQPGDPGHRTQDGPLIGTVLTLREDPLVAELWAGTFDFLSGWSVHAAGADEPGDPGGPGARAQAARGLELLLDEVARLAAEPAPDDGGGPGG
jgi:hypothetical protein